MLPGAIIRNPRIGFDDFEPMELPDHDEQGRPLSRPVSARGTWTSTGFVDRPTSAEKQSRKGMMRDYTGHVPSLPSGTDELRRPLEKPVIKGYSGHVHGFRGTFGARFSTCIEESKTSQQAPKRPQSAQAASRRRNSPDHLKKHRVSAAHQAATKKSIVGGRFDRMGRYHDAIVRLEKEENMTQDMLLRIIQAKVQERSMSHAQQKIRIRCMFEMFDMDGSGDVDETEFRRGLELLNIQLSDVMATAAFAIFDADGDGTVPYEDFYVHLAIPNPGGGTAIYPKPITTTKDRFNHYDHTFTPSSTAGAFLSPETSGFVY